MSLSQTINIVLFAKLNVSQFAFTLQFSKLMFTKYTTYTANMTIHVQWWRKAANTGEDIPVISSLAIVKIIYAVQHTYVKWSC